VLALSASLTEPTPPNGRKLTVCIQGRQYIWRYTYGNGCQRGLLQRPPALLVHDDGRPRAQTVVS
jgi:heme/copper-type cytochrome/quinol oxidase subunit 2